MARLWTSGFELNSTTTDVEFGLVETGFTVQTGTVRSGTYAGKVTGLVSTTPSRMGYQFASAAGTGPYFVRFYFNAEVAPGSETTISNLTLTAFGTSQLQIRIAPSGGGYVARLFYRRSSDSTIVQTGSDSGVLNLKTWYCFEYKYDRSPADGSQIVELKIDNNIIASTSTLSIDNSVLGVVFGGNNNGEAQTGGTFYFDDLAVNDSTGSSQTSYPGPGKVIRLLPNATGDVNSFATQTGGTAGAGNNFSRVSDVTPDDATTFNGSSTLNEEDLMNVGNSGILMVDKINVVQVGARFRNSTADATAAIRFEIEKTGSGTKTQSASIVPNTTTWSSNSVAAPHNPPITLYADPDGNPWTQVTLDSMQIGYKLQTAPGTGGRRIDVTSVWAYVDYQPGNNAAFLFNFI